MPNADVVILGGIGLKYDEYLKFRHAFEEAGVLSRSIMFIHTASDPVVERLLVPDMALAVAEQFGVRGKRVLVLLTDMTAFADALKEIAISMDQVPSNLGYPGSLYSDLAARYEKAVDFEGAGSITILAVTTMPGDDVTHPVPDNTGYITEGQFYLRKGVIEPFGSLSRLKQLVIGKVTRADHGAIMNSMIRLFAKSREVEQKLAMGFRQDRRRRTLPALREALLRPVHGSQGGYGPERRPRSRLEDPGGVFPSRRGGDQAGVHRPALAPELTRLDRK